jgi:hypothetical protein
VIVEKIAANFKLWADHHSIVSKSLSLFSDIASGYDESYFLQELFFCSFAEENGRIQGLLDIPHG